MTKDELFKLHADKEALDEKWETDVLNRAEKIFGGTWSVAAERAYLDKDGISFYFSFYLGQSCRGRVDYWDSETLPYDVFLGDIEKAKEYLQKIRAEKKKKEDEASKARDFSEFKRLKEKLGL